MIAVQILKLRNRKFPDYLFDRKNNRNFDNWTDGGIGSVFYGELVFWRSQSYMVILSTELLIMGALGIDFLKQVDWFSITILIIPPFILGWIVDKLLLRTCS
ncbi:MAG: hypothetical protein JKY53_01805 [Flavobacteriales bacterium]|nr:hypothetical protein [Flavobacteriales bacterium]